MSVRIETSHDHLLDGRLHLIQPRQGYRVSIDAVLLAAAVAPPPESLVLDVGCGVGAVGLCLLYRRPDLYLVGLEIQSEFVALAQENMRDNNLTARMRVIGGDVADCLTSVAACRQAGMAFKKKQILYDKPIFDHIVTNPPYHPATATRPTKNAQACASHEGPIFLRTWLDFCLANLQNGGRLTLIYRADRLDDVLVALRSQTGNNRIGSIRILPLWSYQGRQAKRILLSARKGGQGRMKLLPGLVLHQAGGGFTAQTENILRAAAPLEGLV